MVPENHWCTACRWVDWKPVSNAITGLSIRWLKIEPGASHGDAGSICTGINCDPRHSPHVCREKSLLTFPQDFCDGFDLKINLQHLLPGLSHCNRCHFVHWGTVLLFQLKYRKTQVKNLTPALCFNYSQSKGTTEASDDKNLKQFCF